MTIPSRHVERLLRAWERVPEEARAEVLDALEARVDMFRLALELERLAGPHEEER